MTPEEILKQYFGYDSFYPGQEEIIHALLSGRDVLAVMPTGAGKSICYQVPALLSDGITLVVSPLISLMQDQVKALNAAGIHAAYINSSLSEGQIRKALTLALEGTYKIIYVAPERLLNEGFLYFAQHADISMVTVDEAHCISQWGQDFRPSYLKIVEFVRCLDHRPVIGAFTATATEEVREDIRCTLGLENAKILVTGFDRPNLYFEVDHAANKDRFVLDYVREHAQESGIVYCATRKNTDRLFELLFKEGISVARYHAGMTPEERKYNQDEFVFDRISVMVATNAFGMGIDKSNVRYVLHYNMPQSMENYYQEAGRAGRDGAEASCILLFSPQDVIIDRFLLEQKDFTEIAQEDIGNIQERDRKRLRVMENYCRSTQCLRNYILRYFGDIVESDCGHCANCRNTFLEKDMTQAARWVINAVTESRGRYGANIITGTLVGANRARLREIGAVNWKSYGKLEDYAEDELKNLIPQMVRQSYLIQTVERYSVLRVGPEAMRLKDPDEKIIMQVREAKESDSASGSGKAVRNSDSLTSLGFRLFEELRGLRLRIAKEQNLPPYIIFTDRTLIDMCVRLPADAEGMLRVSGVAKVKNDRYGDAFLRKIRAFCDAHPNETISTFDAADAERKEEEERRQKEEEKRIAAEKRKEARRKAEFSLSPEDAANFEYEDLAYVTEIKDRMNAVNTAEKMKKLTGKQISDWLIEEGYYTVNTRENGFTERIPTSKGLEEGIFIEHKISSIGTEYTLLKYPEEIQRKIVDHFTEGRTGDGSSFQPS